MSGKIKELFEDIELPAVIAEGEVLTIARRRAKNELNFNVSFSELVPMKELFAASDAISQKLGAEAVIYPKYFSEQFTTSYLYEIFELLKRKFVGINGYFDDAVIDDDGQTFEITLKSGGKSMLLGMGIDKKIEAYVKGIFDKNISVILSSNNELDVEEYVSREAPVERVSVTSEAPKPAKPKYSGGGSRGRRPQ
ncbi:MAG TPA: hypothetical protein DER68_04395, partial [Ruminococcaceae bacterium]|nr:hypothetical protein [Oscillospiraceae bacterium]